MTLLWIALGSFVAVVATLFIAGCCAVTRMQWPRLGSPAEDDGE